MPKTRVEVKLILVNNREHFIGYYKTRQEAFEDIGQNGWKQFLESEGITDDGVVDINFNIVIDEEYYHEAWSWDGRYKAMDKTLLLWEFDHEIAHLETKLRDELVEFDKYNEECGFTQDYRLYSTDLSNGVTLEDKLESLKQDRQSALENY